MTNLVLGINQPSDCLLSDILERVAQLVQESDVDLTAKLRGRLVEELHDLLGHKKRGACPVEGVDGEEEDLADKVANLMVGREGGKRGDGELEKDGLEVPDESLQKEFEHTHIEAACKGLTLKRSIASWGRRRFCDGCSGMGEGLYSEAI